MNTPQHNKDITIARRRLSASDTPLDLVKTCENHHSFVYETSKEPKKWANNGK